MSLATLRTLFGEAEAGFTLGVTLYNEPLPIKREADLSDESYAQLKDIAIHTSKRRSETLLLSSETTFGRGFVAHFLQLKLRNTLCWVDGIAFSEQHKERCEYQLAKLFAKAESQQWIVFFDHAEYLFSDSGEAPEINPRLFKALEQYPGLSILSSDNSEFITLAQIRTKAFVQAA